MGPTINAIGPGQVLYSPPTSSPQAPSAGALANLPDPSMAGLENGSLTPSDIDLAQMAAMQKASHKQNPLQTIITFVKQHWLPLLITTGAAIGAVWGGRKAFHAWKTQTGKTAIDKPEAKSTETTSKKSSQSKRAKLKKQTPMTLEARKLVRKLQKTETQLKGLYSRRKTFKRGSKWWGKDKIDRLQLKDQIIAAEARIRELRAELNILGNNYPTAKNEAILEAV